MNIDVSEDGETVSLDVQAAMRLAELGVNFALACLIAGKTPQSVIDALVQEGGQ